MEPGTIKICPSHPSQGEFVIISADDFNPAIHTKLGEKPVKQEEPVKRKKKAE